MTEKNENPQKDEVTDEQLDAVAGGAETIPKPTTKVEIKKKMPSTGIADENHDKWIEV